ncbi:uncharacterized protein CcaverHIS019_0507100 [Cutaneotrichosporon cavernicola]|uniref:Uncharacterized protein n=1 Tax=Cutaneotrichosporon cavernicola TaxID=279322 RepID=A0AA48L6Z7_9TREE|nr:uncharacterized protein CcaverHIS019_0507100 [Cutaneotrichosporon cavernicola]BEI93082.1 hypothetical protein CcaverHIS019_0507100 [Cutaneotrichosporon cavernicola]BEJ00859.1 hypothetical protein CcaverHIS631_0507160 [Cutaneotrichosporon cavernicola]
MPPKQSHSYLLQDRESPPRQPDAGAYTLHDIDPLAGALEPLVLDTSLLACRDTSNNISALGYICAVEPLVRRYSLPRPQMMAKHG